MFEFADYDFFCVATDCRIFIIVMQIGSFSSCFSTDKFCDQEPQGHKRAPNQQSLYNVFTHLVWLELLARMESLVKRCEHVCRNAVNRHGQRSRRLPSMHSTGVYRDHRGELRYSHTERFPNLTNPCTLKSEFHTRTLIIMSFFVNTGATTAESYPERTVHATKRSIWKSYQGRPRSL